MISEKSITGSMFLHCGTRVHQKSQQSIQKISYQNFQFVQPLNYLHVDLVFIDMNTYILLQSRTNFETFLKENYVIGLGSCYLFTKKMWNMELNMILIVLTTEFPYVTANIKNWVICMFSSYYA